MGDRIHEVFISGTGACLPERVLTNVELEKMVDTSDEWIIQRTGIHERRILDDDQNTSDIAIQASRRALKEAGLPPEEVDSVILATITPDTLCPAGAVYIQSGLGATRASAFDLNAACTGFVYAIAMATGMIRSGLLENILVVGAEALSRVIDYTDRNTCILFGDGAGAVVLSRAPESTNDNGSRIIDSVLRADGSHADLIDIPAGGARRPASVKTVEEHGHFLRVKGKEVFKFAVKAMVELVQTAMERNNFGPDDLTLLIPHQVNVRIIDAAQKKLRIPPEKIYLNLDRYGNTSSASVPIALDEVVRGGQLKRGQLVLMVAFGAGMTWGYNLVRW